MTVPSKKKERKPRATERVSVTAVTVTDRTCAAVLGLEPRVFKEMVRDRNIPHSRVASRIVCRVADVERALFVEVQPVTDVIKKAAATTEPDLDSVDDVLRAIGKRRAS